jgi:hypothetical protein
MAILVPTAAAFKLVPGETVQALFSVNDIPSQITCVARINGGAGAFEIDSMTAFKSVRIPYTSEELLDFPPHLREKRKREGKIELELDGEVGPGQALSVSPGATIEVRVNVHANGAKGSSDSAVLALDGPILLESTLALVIGSGLGVPTVAPTPLQLALAPETEVVRTVTLAGAPSAASAVAVMDAPKGGITVDAVRVYRIDRFPFDERELLEFPLAMRDRLRREGDRVPALVSTVAGGSTFQVPEDGTVEVDVRITAHRDVFGFDGTLQIVANSWAPIRVPIKPRPHAIMLSLDSDRFEIAQGENMPGLAVHARVLGGAQFPFDVRLGQPGDAWVMDAHVGVFDVALGGVHHLSLSGSSASDAPLGEHPTFVVATWYEGIGSTSIPVTVAVRPGLANVQVFARRAATQQGSQVRFGSRIDVKSRKNVIFTPIFLPPNIAFLPPNRQIFDPGSTELDLVFAVDANCRPKADQRVVIGWDAQDGFHRGQIELRLSVLLTRQERQYSRPIVTPDGIPLGGSVGFVLANDGSGRFNGHMRATGALSFAFDVVAAVRSADGKIAVIDREVGEVFGTFDSGDREHRWDRPTREINALRDFWPSIATAEMTTSRAFEFSGFAGTGIDAVKTLIDLAAGLGVLAVVPGGGALAVIVLSASNFAAMTDIDVLGPGGLPGVLAGAGALFLVGPSVLIPVFVSGVGIGAAAMKHRPLSDVEKVFAREVFGDSLPFDRIRVTNLTGLGGVEFTCPAGGSTILINMGKGGDLDDLSKYTRGAYAVPGQVLIHELVHAWQIAHRAFDTQFLWDGIVGKILFGQHYHYEPPGGEFSGFSLEGQASIVDEWFAGVITNAPRVLFTSKRVAKDPNDIYFRYIDDNIRRGIP